MNAINPKPAVKAPATPQEGSSDFSSATHLRAFLDWALPDCRPLADWEREDADEFFAANFADAPENERSEV